MDVKYIYGIIDSSEEGVLDVMGLGGTDRAYTVACRGVACVVSDYSGPPFTEMSREKVVQSLLTHQVVLERLMEKRHTVLPVKFGTVVASACEAHQVLSEGHSRFVEALVRLGDSVEIEVAATWDTPRVLREISNEDDIVRAREAISARGVPPTLEERVHLGQMVKAAMDGRRDNYRQRMTKFLKPLALDAEPNALVADDMVMNVAFLVEKERQGLFDSRIRKLNDLFDDHIHFRVIGPLPPYSFATVEVAKVDPEAMAEARHLLCLDHVVSEAQVRSAYRHLAAGMHPDRGDRGEMPAASFAQLRQASDLLLSYCRGRTGPAGGFLVTIGRRAYEDVQHLRLAGVGV